MLKQLIAQLTRLADALEVHNRIAADKNELSERMLSLQIDLLEAEQSRTVVHVKPDIGTLTAEVSEELSNRVRRSAGSGQA